MALNPFFFNIMIRNSKEMIFLMNEYWDITLKKMKKQQGEDGAARVLLCGVQSDGTVTPVLVDSDGKLITTTGAE